MRVHELAKATQLESKDIIAIAKKHRVAIKPSPSANVEDKDIRKLMPYIDKHKSESKLREEDDRRKKEEDRKKKDEERRKKEEERRTETESKKKTDEDSKRKAEEESRIEARKKVDETRRLRDEQAKMEREEESRRRQEDSRLRSLGLPVPNRAAGFRPRIAPPAPPPRPAEQQGSASRPPLAPRPAGQSPRPGMGGFNQGAGTRPAAAPGTTAPRPEGAAPPRPSAPGEPRQGGFRPGAGAPQPGGQRPPYQNRPQQGQGGPRPQGQGYQGGQGGPRPQGQGYQGAQGGPRPQGQGYQGQQGQGFQGQRPQGQGYQGQRPQGQGYQGGQRPPGQGYQGGQGGQRPPGQGYQGRPSGPGGPGGQRPPFNPRGPQQQRPGGPGGERRRDDGSPAKLTEGNLPQIGVMRLDKAAPRRTDKDRRPVDAKKKGKVAPRKIFELDEDMTVTTKPKSLVTPRSVGGPPGGGGRFGSRRPGGRKVKRRGDSRNDRSSGPTVKSVTVEGNITVGQFAEKLGIPPTEIIKKVLLDMGEALTINAMLTQDHVTLLAPEFGVELEYIPVGDEYDVEAYQLEDDPEKMVRRPPVVTIMGHVDHGKTSLLDFVRSSNVVKGEFGGITQHIGAYLVHTAKGDIVFLDTPGHEAFTSMRARGASVTDLVILVVAANDGFKPQTIEALNHAKAAQVPIVVAVNKIDLPGADPAKVRQEALQHNLVPEELGGDVIFVDISAKVGTNVEQLLEMVALQSEILDLKADPERPAQGTVVESHLDPQRGAVATVLVQKGTLKSGDYFVAGEISGRVRAMNNDRGKSTKFAGPSIPVEIIGLTASPPAGEVFLVMPDDATARKIAGTREIRRRAAGLAPVTNRHVTLENLHDMMEEGKTQDLNLIVKGDVQGSVEAIRHSLDKLSNNQIRLRFLHLGVGGVNESDVNLAAASDAVIIGFNVRPEQPAQDLADQEGVEIKSYRIIYDLIEDVKAAMLGLLAPTFKEKILGHAEVRQIFRASRLGTIAGCFVKDGEIVRDSKVRVLRDSVVVYEGDLGSLRRVKEDVKKVATNMECGITVGNFNDVKEGDIIESYEMEQMAPTLNAPTAG